MGTHGAIRSAFFVSMAALLATGAAASFAGYRLQQAVDTVTRHHDAVTEFERLNLAVFSLESGVRSYVVAGDETSFQRYERGRDDIGRASERIEALQVQIDPDLQLQLAALLRSRVDLAAQTVALRRSGELDQAVARVVQDGRDPLSQRILKVTTGIIESQHGSLREAQLGSDRQAMILQVMVAVGALMALIIVGVMSRRAQNDLVRRARAEEERDRFFSLSMDMLCIASVDGYFRRVSPAFEATLGWTAEEVAYRPFFEFIHPDDHAATIAELEGLRSGRPGIDFENRYRHRDGGWRWISWRTTPLPDGTLIATGRDVTRQKEDQLALAELMAWQGALLKSADVAIISASEDGLIRSFNPAAERLLGYRADELVDREMLGSLHSSEDSDQLAEELSVRLGSEVDPQFEAHVALARRGIEDSRVASYRRRDGQQVPVLLTVSALRDAGGAITGFLEIAVDITDRQLALSLLRESEESLAVTLDSIGDGVLAIDIQRRVTRLNPVAEQLTGWTLADALGRPVEEVFHIISERTRLPSVIPVDEVLRTGKVQGLANHTLLIARDGSERPIADSAAPIRDRDGAISGVVLVFRDVSEEKAAEDALRDSEALNRAILDSILANIAVVDDAGRILAVNEGWRQFARDNGASPDHPSLSVGANYLEVCAPALAQNWPDAWACVEGIKRVLDGRLPAFRGEYACSSPSQERWFNMQVSSLGRADGGAVIAHFDVSRLKEAEAEVRRLNNELRTQVEDRTAELGRQVLTTKHLLENVDDAVVACDAQGTVTFFNPKASLLFADAVPDRREGAWTSRVAMFSSDGQRVLSEDEFPLWKALDGETITNEELVVRPVGGAARVLLASASPLDDEHGAPLGALMVLRDITLRRQHERLAYRSQRLEALGTLAGGIAHDLNNALAPISMGVELLREQFPTESRTLDVFASCARRGSEMIRQLLTFARGADGERAPVQFARLVREVDKLIRASFPKNIESVIRCPQGLPQVQGDATQLHQVLLNLSVNARDAMPAGGRLTIELGVREVDEVFASEHVDARPGRFLFLRVEDTGVGIPPDQIERIFDPFFSTKGADRGTGLGLSTVLGIVRGHQGFIQVYSQPGKGATFTVFLPVEAQEDSLDVEVLPMERLRGQGQRVLFVDDEPSIRELAAAVLRRLNYQPILGKDGADGLTRLSLDDDPVDVLITDLHMPTMDGLSLIRAARHIRPDLPIILASGRVDEAVDAELRAAGISYRLDKPFTEPELARVLWEALGRSRPLS